MAKIAEVQEVDVSKLIPYERNAKQHSDEQVEKICNSIREFGFISPCLIDRDYNVIAGHGRIMAAKKIGMGTVPCLFVEGLTETQRKAYILADNRLTELGEWDMDIVNAELQELELADFDISLTGFDYDNAATIDMETFEDEPPEPPEIPITKPGDLWKLGEHRLICGDSTDTAVIENLMGGKKADMIFTDPPYGYSFQSNMRTQTEKFDVIKNDDKILDFFQAVKGVCSGWVYVCTTWKTADKWTELFKRYYELTNVIIWDKGGGGIGDLFHTFSTDYEMILVCNNGKELKGKRYGSVWNFADAEIAKMKKEELLRIVLEQKEYYSIWKQGKDNPNEYVHPTQKPVALSAKAIRSSTEFGDVVLDLFGGSGSTLIACEQLNRKCCMVELDPHYCDVIIKRWEDITGGKAVLLNG